MSDPRQEYKSLVLHACRIAVEGGEMTREYEDFVIDHIDEIIDRLSDADFHHLVMKGTVPARHIEHDDEYSYRFKHMSHAEELIQNESAADMERDKLQNYHSTLEGMTNEYKDREWSG